MSAPAEISADELYAVAAFEDFPTYCRLITHGERVIDSALRSEGGQRIVAALMDLEAGRTKRLILNLPPRHAKSYIATQLFTSWFMGRHPGTDSILATHTARFSERLAGRVRDWTQDPIYRAAFGTALKMDTRSKGQWTLTSPWGNSQLFAVGVDGPVIGRGISGLGLIDDPIKKQKQATNPRVLDEQEEWYRQEFETRLDSADARILLIMQRWAEGDLAGRLQAAEPDVWTTVTIPAIIDEGLPTERTPWPERFDLDRMRQIKAIKSPRWWSALYGQDPQSNEEKPFRDAERKAWAPAGELRDAKGNWRARVSAYFDPSWGGEDWAPYVAGMRLGPHYVVVAARIWQEQIGTSKAKMLRAHAESKADRLRIELNSKGEAFYDHARAAGITAEGVENTENKYSRIERNLVKHWGEIYFWFDGGMIDPLFVKHLKEFSPPEDWNVKVPRADAADALAGLLAMLASGMTGLPVLVDGY